MTTNTTTETLNVPTKATPKPKGNLSKAVVQQLVETATPEQIATLFTGKGNKPCTLVSRARAVEVLALTGAKKKAIEEYTYPVKRKSRKAVVKVASSTAVSKDDYKDFSNDKLINSIKEYKNKLKAMEEQLADRLK